MVAATQISRNPEEDVEFSKVETPAWLAKKNGLPMTLYGRITRDSPKAVLLKTSFYNYDHALWLPKSQIVITPMGKDKARIVDLIKDDLVKVSFIDDLLTYARQNTRYALSSTQPNSYDVVPKDIVETILERMRDHVENKCVKDNTAMIWWIQTLYSSHQSFARQGMYLWALEGVFNFNVYLPQWSVEQTSPKPNYGGRDVVAPPVTAPVKVEEPVAANPETPVAKPAKKQPKVKKMERIQTSIYMARAEDCIDVDKHAWMCCECGRVWMMQGDAKACKHSDFVAYGRRTIRCLRREKVEPRVVEAPVETPAVPEKPRQSFEETVARCEGCDFHRTAPVERGRTYHACVKPGFEEEQDKKRGGHTIAYGVHFGEGSQATCDPDNCGMGR